MENTNKFSKFIKLGKGLSGIKKGKGVSETLSGMKNEKGLSDNSEKNVKSKKNAIVKDVLEKFSKK